jgi:hypothetical protein
MKNPTIVLHFPTVRSIFSLLIRLNLNRYIFGTEYEAPIETRLQNDKKLSSYCFPEYYPS